MYNAPSYPPPLLLPYLPSLSLSPLHLSLPLHSIINTITLQCIVQHHVLTFYFLHPLISHSPLSLPPTVPPSLTAGQSPLLAPSPAMPAVPSSSPPKLAGTLGTPPQPGSTPLTHGWSCSAAHRTGPYQTATQPAWAVQACAGVFNANTHMYTHIHKWKLPLDS